MSSLSTQLKQCWFFFSALQKVSAIYTIISIFLYIIIIDPIALW